MASLSLGARVAFAFGALEAQQLASADIDLEHLFLGACKAASLPDAPNELGEELEMEPDQFTQLKTECAAFGATLSAGGLHPTPARRRLRAIWRETHREEHAFSGHRSHRCRRVFAQADGLAVNEVDLLVLMHAMLVNSSAPIEQLLTELQVSRDQLFGALRGAAATAIIKPGDGASIAGTPAPPAPAPAPGYAVKFGRDLTALGRAGKLIRAVGREDETRRLARVLMQAKKNNPLLVGEPGVGKTAIVEGLALQIGEPTAAPALARLRLVEVSLGALVAGTKYRGEFEERVQKLIKESEADPNLVLFIDELHLLLGAGSAGSGSMDAADLLKPALARGKMRVIGATTTDEYRKTIESDAALERRFEVLWVEEPSRETAIRILEAVCPSLEEHHGVMIARDALVKAVDLSIRYLPDRRLPDKALDVIDQACARAMLSTLTPKSLRSPDVTAAIRVEIGAEAVAAAISERCRIPVERLTQDEGLRLLAMEEVLSRRVIGQEAAVGAVAEIVRTGRAGLKDPRRPLGVFLFLGPTGTGKTELAKALAEFLFGDERRLIRIDMSEYQEKASVSRLLGAPPGYIGHDEGGQLTDRVRNDPYSVVLFDEIEKAHPDTFDIFLQMFDEGELTDSKGRKASFRECVIVMTSNLGSAAEPERARVGFAAGARAVEPGQSAAERRHREAAARALRPELLNRIQRVVVFQPLGRASLPGIIDKVLRRVRAQVAERGIEVRLSPAAYELLAEEGYSDEFGAREMERAIERLVIEPLGRALLEGRVKDDDIVRVEVVDGAIELGTGDGRTA